MRIHYTYTFSILVVTMMIGGAISLVKEHKIAEAQVVPTNIPFAGRIVDVQLCCNGLMITQASPPVSVAYGTFVFPFTNMVPVPAIGLGFYSWWSPTVGQKTLGSSLPGGVCTTVASECTVSIPTAFTIKQMGTTLLPTV